MSEVAERLISESIGSGTNEAKDPKVLAKEFKSDAKSVMTAKKLRSKASKLSKMGDDYGDVEEEASWVIEKLDDLIASL